MTVFWQNILSSLHENGNVKNIGSEASDQKRRDFWAISAQKTVTFAGVMIDRKELIREAKAKYSAYNPEDWILAGFDEISGGYRVYHKDHQFDPTVGIFDIPRGDYEKNASEVLVQYGMSVVLYSEKSEYATKKPDGLLNGVLFDIKGIEGKSSRTVKSKISEAGRQGAETAVLYYHDKICLTLILQGMVMPNILPIQKANV